MTIVENQPNNVRAGENSILRGTAPALAARIRRLRLAKQGGAPLTELSIRHGQPQTWGPQALGRSTARFVDAELNDLPDAVATAPGS
jgi:hypothetical protein